MLTTAGLTGDNKPWRACCARGSKATFTTDAPDRSLNVGSGNLDTGAGVRRATCKVNGRYAGSNKRAGGVEVHGDGAVTGAEKNVDVADIANPGLADDSLGHTNDPPGANYRLTPDA